MSDKRKMGDLAAQDNIDWSQLNQPFGMLSDPDLVLYRTPSGVEIRGSNISAATDAALGASGGGWRVKTLKASRKLGEILNPRDQQ